MRIEAVMAVLAGMGGAEDDVDRVLVVEEIAARYRKKDDHE